MTTPLVFTFPETAQHVRSVMVDGEPWWIAVDVATVLEIGRTHDAVRSLDEDERGTETIRTPGGDQEVTVVNEPGLYSLILRSRKPQAKTFKRWITHEVIPSIRQTGSYSVQAEKPMSEMDMARGYVAALEREQELVAKVAELEPAARAWDVLASGDGDFSVADAAKILSRDPRISLGQNRLFTILADWRWTYRQTADGRYRAMQSAVDSRRLSEIPSSHYHPRTGELVLDAPKVRVTVKGLHEIHRRLGGIQQLHISAVPAPRQSGGAA